MSATNVILMVMTVILVLVAGLMVFLILLQEGKSGGLAALGGTSASATMGVSNPLRRGTTYLAIIMFVLAVIINIAGKTNLKAESEFEYDAEQDVMSVGETDNEANANNKPDEPIDLNGATDNNKKTVPDSVSPDNSTSGTVDKPGIVDEAVPSDE